MGLQGVFSQRYTPTRPVCGWIIDFGAPSCKMPFCGGFTYRATGFVQSLNNTQIEEVFADQAEMHIKIRILT
jgi:hypothetical protein